MLRGFFLFLFFFFSIVLSVVVATAYGVGNNATATYLALVSDEIVDYTTVEVAVGSPPRVVRLRVLYGSEVTNLHSACLLPALLVLFEESRTLKHRSSTFQTIVPSVVGADIIDLAGLRLWDRIAFAPRPSGLLDPVYASAASMRSLSSAASADGFLCLEPLRRSHWTTVEIDRHGILLLAGGELAPTRRLDHHPHLTIQPCSEESHELVATLAAQSGFPYPVACMGCVDATLADDSRPLQVCFVPDMNAALVPEPLYLAFFARESLQERLDHIDPSKWPSMRLRLGGSREIAWEWQGRSILPLIDGAGTIDLAVLRHRTQLSVAGGDSLKMLPQSLQDRSDVIVVGGHILWSSAMVELHASSSAFSVPTLVFHTPEDEFSIGHAIVVIAAVFVYLRGKLSIIKYELDFGASRPSSRTPLYLFQSVLSGADVIVWPYVLALWSVPLIIGLRYGLVRELLSTAALAPLSLAVAIAAYAVLLGLVVAQPERAALLHVLKTARKKFWHSNFSLREWFRQTFVDAEAGAAAKNARLALRYSRPIPSSAAREVAIDLAVLIAAWFYFSPFESRSFALPLLLIIVTTLAVCIIFETVTLLFITAWPVATSLRLYLKIRRVAQPSWTAVAASAWGIGASTYALYLCVVGALMPLLESFNSGPITSLASVVTLLFICTLVLLASVLADVSLQTLMRQSESESL